MVKMWFVRPGENAFLWNDCKDNNCIAIGWDNEDGYLKYTSLSDVKNAGHGSNNANSIWYLYNDIKIGNIVVAIKGNNSILGIGKVTSGYIGPNDPKNPQIEYRNVRLVQWYITERLDDLSYDFAQKTITPLKPADKWEEIKAGYIKKDSKYREIFAKLEDEDDMYLSDLIKQFVAEINGVQLKEHRNEHENRSNKIKNKLTKKNVEILTEDEMLDILKDTDAAYGVRFELSKIFLDNDGFENFKNNLFNFLDKTNPNENDVNKIIDFFKSMGHGFLSEFLCLKSPTQFWIWNSVIDNFFSKMGINIKQELPHGSKGDEGKQYIAMHPYLEQILQELKQNGLNDATYLDVDLFAWWAKDIDGSIHLNDFTQKFPILDDAFSHTRNVILYGPPGTGKTYMTQQFIKGFLGSQISTPKSFNEIKLELLQELTWYQVIALSIYMKDKSGKFKVSDLKNDELIKDYFDIVKGRTKNIAPTLWSQLQTHADPDSDTIKYERRHPPALFDKTSESEWKLISNGTEYVETNLSEVIDILSGNPNLQEKTTIEQFCTFITFHQSYGYEDFIEGLKPTIDDTGVISYEIKPGVFKQICEKATHDPENNYVLVIDEINRGNIAKIFGELITLIEDDKRSEGSNKLSVKLPYSTSDFIVPSNLYIIGTMNTADRSIALLDIALRRRFTFLEIMPDYSILDYDVDGINLGLLLSELNGMVSSLIDRDHQIGHSYFCEVIDLIKKGDQYSAKQKLYFVWYKKIIPLLQEYFYNDWEQLKPILGDFLSESDQSNNNPRLEGKIVNKNYVIHDFNNDWVEFSSALNRIINNETPSEVDNTRIESEIPQQIDED